MQKPSVFFAALAAALLAISPLALGGGHLTSTENVDKIRPGVTSAQQLQDLLGAPLRKMHFQATGLDAWEYEYRDYSDTVVLSISIGSDGVVRNVAHLRRGCV
jgi:outer membrane protein assembly factor BamE (lipoprotein component of BamABCDE complex)